MKFIRTLAAAALLASCAGSAQADIYLWSQTPASNTNSDLADDVNLVEGMAPSEVNDSARAMMAEIAKWRDDLGGIKSSAVVMTTAGSANAQTLSTNGTASVLTHGHKVCGVIGAGLTNTSTVTLNVDGLGAKAVQGLDGTALAGGELAAGSLQCWTYQSSDQVWLMQGYAPIDASTITYTSTGTLQRAALSGDISASAGSNTTAIGSSKVTSAMIVDSTIATGDVAADTLTKDDIATSAIETTEILDSTITTSDIAADTIAAGDMAADSVAASEIAADAVGTSEIATDGVGAAEIVADGVGSSEIAADAVGASEISTGAVSTTEILDGTIVAADLSGTAGGLPVGMVFDFAGSTCPTGSVAAYGQELNDTTYSALLAVISTTYGAGGASTFLAPDLRGRFGLGQDDMGGVSANRVVDGTDSLNGDTLADTGGVEFQSIAEAELPSHDHGLSGSFASGSASVSHTHSFSDTSSGQSVTHTHSFTAVRGNGGDDAGTGNQRNSADDTSSGTTGSASVDHTHTISGTSGGHSVTHTHTTTLSGNTGTAGSGTAISVMPPSIVLNKCIWTGV